jgi:succinyl-diaminopimelate desuccinylase
LIDPINLAQALIRRRSVTPADAGAMDVLEAALGPLGFSCRRLTFGGIENLYARLGDQGPNLCFAGHTDVVPAGDEAAWSTSPFAGEIIDGTLHGRGAVDMKGAIAAFVAASAAALTRRAPKGSLSLLITGDEEGEGIDGTRRVVETLLEEGERIDHCIVGEPSSAAVLGDMIKVGRRGSVNAWITVEGVQGHVAYPHRAANPAPVLIRLLNQLQMFRLDDGYPEFQPSNLEVTELKIGNPAANVIPAKAEARLNIRFNPVHTGASLQAWLQAACQAAEADFKGQIHLRTQVSGEAFITPPGPFTAMISRAVKAVCGVSPELSTTGGTSDARFIRALCPVVELGLVGSTMHMIDERAAVKDVETLAALYEAIILSYWDGPPSREGPVRGGAL